MKTKSSKLVIVFIILLSLGIGGFIYIYNNVLLPKSDIYLLQIQVKNKQKSTDGILTRYISQKMGTFVDKPSLHTFEANFRLYYDTTKYDHPEYNFDYVEFYLVPENNIYPRYKKISDEYATIKLTPWRSNVKPFLNKSDYCVNNDDCIIRTNICSNGVYNKYQWFFDVYGCEGPGGEYDVTGNCYKDINYSNPKCVNNKCTADKTVSNKCEVINF